MGHLVHDCRRNNIRSGNIRGCGMGECWREEWGGGRGRWETNLGGGEGGGDEHGGNGGGERKERGQFAGKGYECIKRNDIGLLLRVRCFIIIVLMTYEISEMKVCYPDIFGA